MPIRFATNDEVARWDNLIASNPDGGNVFQSYEIATVKQQSGWKPRFLVAGNLAITVHERRVPGLGCLWYIPKGPGLTDVSAVKNQN